MSDFREEEKLGKLYDTQLTRRVIKYLRPYRWLVTVAVVMSLAVAGAEILGPYLFARGVDRFIVPGMRGEIVRSAALMGLWWVVLAYLGSIVASFGLQYIQVRIMQWVGQQTMYDLRKEIFEHLQRLPMSFFDRSPIGRLVTRSTTDVDALNDLFATGVAAMLNDFVLLISLCVYLIYKQPFLGAGDAFPSAVHDPAHVHLPQSCSRRKPPDSYGDRADQWIPAGTHQRNVHRAAFQSRAKVMRAIRRFESRPHGSVQGRH